MKRRAIIGLSIMVLVLAIVFGIASLPDEVLLGPSSQNFQPKSEEFQFVPPNEESETIENSEPVLTMSEKTTFQLEELRNEVQELKKELTELKIDSNLNGEILPNEDPQEVFSDEEGEGKMIRISLKDGVGAVEK